MMSDYIFVVDNEGGMRVDKFLSEQIPDRSRSFITTLIKDSQVFVNDKIVLTNYMATNPKPKEVVISNVDISREIMFIENSDTAYKLSYCNYKTLKALNLQKGDTVKIILHPVLTESVIEISK